MSEASATRGRGRAPAAAGDLSLILFILGLGLVLLVLVVLADGNVAAVVAPFGAIGVLVLIWRIPVRYTALTMLFLGCVLEAPYEAFAGYEWRSPIYLLGSALLGNLNLVTGIRALKFTGMDALLVYLLVIIFHRRVTRSTIDGPGFVPVARPMLWATIFSAGTALVQLARGLALGGDLTNGLWQLHMFTLVPVFVVVLQSSLRGSRDLKALATLFLSAAVIRALLAVYIHNTVVYNGEPLPYATTHADSMLFSTALVLTFILRNERTSFGPWLAALVAAILCAGMVANGRRLAWVVVVGSLLAVVLISPWTALKRRMARGALFLAPIVFVYLSAGWNSEAGIFKPAAMIRSVVDSKSDSSSLWRDMENENLIKNIGLHPLIGTGFGHEYIEFEVLPDVAGAYPQFRAIPHNSFLAGWAFAGWAGFTAMWTMLVVCVFMAARAYHRSSRPAVRAASLACVTAVIAYINQVYGDIGVSQWLGPLLLAPAMVVAGKLAVETGAWPASAARPSSSELPAPRRGFVSSPVADPARVLPFAGRDRE